MIDLVKGKVVGIPVLLLVRVTLRVILTVTVIDLVNGRVVGIPLRVILILGDFV